MNDHSPKTRARKRGKALRGMKLLEYKITKLERRIEALESNVRHVASHVMEVENGGPRY